MRLENASLLQMVIAMNRSSNILNVVCAWCHKAEKINGEWVKNDKPLESGNTSHGICPVCSEKEMERYLTLYPKKAA